MPFVPPETDPKTLPLGDCRVFNWGDIVGWSAEDYLMVSDGTMPPPTTGTKIDLLPYIKEMVFYTK